MSNERIERYKLAKQNRIDGKYNGAPLFYKFPRLGKLIPAIPKGKQIMTLAGSGTGKSQSVIGVSLMTLYYLIKKHNYKAKIFIALLEDPLELFEDRLFSAILFLKKGIIVDPLDLNSMRENPLSDNIIQMFEEIDALVDDVLSYCTIIDNVYNPTGLYHWLRDESGKLGNHVYEKRIFTYKEPNGTITTKEVDVYKEYIPNDPELHCFVIIDNLNNLAEERDKELQKTLDVREAIGKWCRDYARLQIVKHWDWTVWNIMQTALETDRKQFTNRGESIVEKLEPNLSSLGDNKLVSRDHHLIFGLFAPSRFGIEDYEGYNITKLQDRFRALIVLKSNLSVTNIKIPLYFNGACSYFTELPKLSEMNNGIYELIENNKFI